MTTKKIKDGEIVKFPNTYKPPPSALELDVRAMELQLQKLLEAIEDMRRRVNTNAKCLRVLMKQLKKERLEAESNGDGS